MVLPAAIDRENGVGDGEAPVGGDRLVHHLRLDGEDHHVGVQIGRKLRGPAHRIDAELGDLPHGLAEGLDDRDRRRLDAAVKPARQQGATHLSATNEEHFRIPQASPTVSIIDTAMASAAVLPPQITYWKAG